MEDVELGGRIMLKKGFKLEWEEVKWIGLARDWDNWIVFVSTVMNILVLKGRGICFYYMRN
jgi:hypothetical protein